jgi:hypothetical protein
LGEKKGALSAVLTISILIGVAVLLVLIVVSLIRQHQDRAAQREAAARAYTGEAKAQHDESLRRRDAVRAAHAARPQPPD